MIITIFQGLTIMKAVKYFRCNVTFKYVQETKWKSISIFVNKKKGGGGGLKLKG